MTTQAQVQTVIGHYTIGGIKIARVEVEPSHDLRFKSQRQLQEMGSVGAYAELRRRTQIIAQRSA